MGSLITNKLTFNSSRALLAYLAVEGGTHTRTALAGLLWPESTDSEARNNLRQTVFKLTRLLGKGTLVSTRQTLGLAIDCQTDVSNFAGCRWQIHDQTTITYRSRKDCHPLSRPFA